METKTCLYCGATLPTSHGNVKYCPNKDCENLTKKYRQTNKYVIGDNAKKAIQKNHALFLKVLGDNNRVELELWQLLKLGFDLDGYYKSGFTQSSQKKVLMVHDCYFHITSDNPQKIEIWITSKK